MSNQNKKSGGIAWTDETWNPIRGCSRVSPGCINCYAEKIAGRFCGNGQPYEGIAINTSKGARWTSKVALTEEHLNDPIRGTRPRDIFVNSMSDLFHENLSYEEIKKIFSVMSCSSQHTFQILTKRAERLEEFGKKLFEEGFWRSNIWMGVSVENKDYLYRLEHLKNTPAMNKFVSFEPLLNRLGDIKKYLNGIDWVIIGGESGPDARICDISWITEIVEQCQELKVSCFVKQMGQKAVNNGTPVKFVHFKGGNPEEWPENLKIREMPK